MAAGNPAAPFEAADALGLLLTTESLLLAALAISVALTAPSPDGRSPLLARGGLAIGVALAISIVAAGACAAWWELFGHRWPDSPEGTIEAGALAAGICAQVALGWGIALGIARFR